MNDKKPNSDDGEEKKERTFSEQEVRAAIERMNKNTPRHPLVGIISLVVVCATIIAVVWILAG